MARRFSSATRGIARRIVDGRIDVGRAELFPDDVEVLFVDTYETLVRVTEELDVARDLLGGVRDYYQAKITEQQNDVAKKLTVIASLVLVPSLIVGFYGQNFAGQFERGVLEHRRLARPDRDDHAGAARTVPLASLDLDRNRPSHRPTPPLPSKRVSAPAHTPAPTGEAIAVEARAHAVFDHVLPYLGPGLALLLGLVGLGRRSLDVDEATTVAAAQGSFSDVVERALSDDPARAGYLALLQPVVERNDAEIWVRAPSALAAFVAAVAAYRLGRRLAGRTAGAAASIILATSIGVVELSRSVGPIALALAAMLLSSALFARAVERGNAMWWAVYAVSAALLPLTHPIAASALVAQLAALAVARREVDLRLALPAAGVAVLESGLFLTASVLDRDGRRRRRGTARARRRRRRRGARARLERARRRARRVGHRDAVPGLDRGEGRWKAVLVAGLAVVPLVAVLVGGIALPVYPRAALAVSCRRRGARRRHRPGRDSRPESPHRRRAGDRRRRDRDDRRRRAPRATRGLAPGDRARP